MKLRIPEGVKQVKTLGFSNKSKITEMYLPTSFEDCGSIFNGFTELTDVYCYAENVPSLKSDAFDGFPVYFMSLHIPKVALEDYKNTEPWNKFGTIVALYDKGSGTLVDGIYYKFDAASKTAVVTQGDIKYKGVVNLPEKVSYNGIEYNVKSIGEEAFYDCPGLTSITIPNSIKFIGLWAFRDCHNLTSVHITDIEAWCKIRFANAAKSNPLYYAHHIFVNGKEIKDLIIPNSITSINWHSFYGCSGLTSVTIPNSVTSIGQWAFTGCSGLTSVTIPNSVTEIGDGAFCRCSSLTFATIPNSVTSIGDEVFYKCSSLSSVTIPDNITSIGWNVFWGCTSLTSITIPNSVTSIGVRAFKECSGLTSVTIPNSVITIGTDAFSGCINLASVTIGKGVTTIEEYAFEGCSSLTSVSIPNSVTAIGYDAFGECINLASVTIGKSVTTIDDFAFYKCSKLKDVYCYPKDVPATESYVFSSSPISSATLHVPATSINAFKEATPWKEFGNFVALDEPALRGDINSDEVVNGTDIQAVINVIVDGEYDEKADINEDGKVNGTDIQEVINIIVNSD